ncbi:MAG: hypothetical protein ABIE94_02985 [archaeon]
MKYLILIILIIAAMLFISACGPEDMADDEQEDGSDVQTEEVSGTDGEVEEAEPADEPEPPRELVCNPPYIRHATSCCLDLNDNMICDVDEPDEEETPEDDEEELVEDTLDPQVILDIINEARVISFTSAEGSTKNCDQICEDGDLTCIRAERKHDDTFNSLDCNSMIVPDVELFCTCAEPQEEEYQDFLNILNNALRVRHMTEEGDISTCNLLCEDEDRTCVDIDERKENCPNCPNIYTTWKDENDKIIRSESYEYISDDCTGYRCLENIQENLLISPECYNEDECAEACTDAHKRCVFAEWNKEGVHHPMECDGLVIPGGTLTCGCARAKIQEYQLALDMLSETELFAYTTSEGDTPSCNNVCADYDKTCIHAGWDEDDEYHVIGCTTKIDPGYNMFCTCAGA